MSFPGLATLEFEPQGLRANLRTPPKSPSSRNRNIPMECSPLIDFRADSQAVSWLRMNSLIRSVIEDILADEGCQVIGPFR